MYKIKKINKVSKLVFPWFRRVVECRDIDWFKISAYNFLERLTFELNLHWLQTKAKVEKTLN